VAEVDVLKILDKAAKSAFRGGTAGAAAMGINVFALMWMRTTINYQYRYGRARARAHACARERSPSRVDPPQELGAWGRGMTTWKALVREGRVGSSAYPPSRSPGDATRSGPVNRFGVAGADALGLAWLGICSGDDSG
jgi:hypothetical protein